MYSCKKALKDEDGFFNQLKQRRNVDQMGP